jgi:hypothetical protein
MKKKNQETDKKWLFKEILNGYGQGSGLMFLPLQMVFHLRNLISDDFVLGSISFFIVSLALVQYIVLVIIPQKAENYLKEVYPDYEFSK